jgi:Mg-chelatase subunit ChlD
VLVLAVCAVVVGSVGATSATAVQSSLSATDVSTCGGVSDVTVTLQAQDPAAAAVPLDVMFVLDESTGTSAADFSREKQFVHDLASGWIFAPGNVNAGVVAFSTTARVPVPMSSIQASFLNGVAALQKLGGNTSIGDGLQRAKQELDAHGRNTPNRVYIVLTDGLNNVNNAQLPTVEASLHADPRNVIYAIGVGATVDANALHAIASTILGTTTTFTNIPDVATLSGQIAPLMQQPAVAGTDLSYRVTPAAGWDLVAGSATATQGTIAPTSDGFAWSLATLHTGTVTLHYQLRHTGTYGGNLVPQATADLSWTDATNGAQTQSLAAQAVMVTGCSQVYVGPAVRSSLSATDVSTCGGVSDVTVTLQAQDPAAAAVPLDVMFVLDESTGTSAADFSREKQFVHDLASGWIFAPGNVNAGVVAFSTTARVPVPMSSIQASFLNGVAALQKLGGNTSIGDGLQRAKQELDAHGRNTPNRVYIVLTDGLNNVNNAQLPTVEASLHADPRNVIYAIGVGATVDANALHAIASTILGTTTTFTNIPDVATLSGQIAPLMQQPAVAGTDLSYRVTPAAGWDLVAGSATATQGTIAPTSDGFAWSLATLHTGTVTLHYQLRHTGTYGGNLVPQATADLSWTDATNGAQTQSLAAQAVSVADCNQPPVAHASAPAIVHLSGSHSAPVPLNGSASTDDGQIQPLSYTWSENGTTISTDQSPTVDLGIGSHLITLTVDDGQYQATDTATVTIDDPTAPLVTPHVAGTTGTAGWLTSDAVVSFEVSDLESDVTPGGGCSDTTLSADTAGTTFTCSAASAGGTTTATVTVKRDGTPPVVTYTPSGATYGVADTVSIACAVSDATSGVAGSATCPGASGAAYTFAAGRHTLSYTATDNAGNIGRGTATFTIVVDPADVCALVRRWTDNAGVANSLCVKLTHGSTRAFTNEVNAQRGKHLQADKADLLIRLANAL